MGAAARRPHGDHPGGTEWTCANASNAPEGAFCDPDTEIDAVGPAAENAIAPVGSHANAAGLTVYDMCKGVDRGITLEAGRLVHKRGGKSGSWTRPGESDPGGVFS